MASRTARYVDSKGAARARGLATSETARVTASGPHSCYVTGREGGRERERERRMALFGDASFLAPQISKKNLACIKY